MRLTETLQLDVVIEEALLAVALITQRRVQTEAALADLLAEEGALVSVWQTQEATP